MTQFLMEGSSKVFRSRMRPHLTQPQKRNQAAKNLLRLTGGNRPSDDSVLRQ